MKLPVFLTFAAVVALNAAEPYPTPKFLGEPDSFGRGIQRTMRLLATSTPEKRNTVRVLFYGQSITEQGWWKIVADDLADLLRHHQYRCGRAFPTRIWSSKTARLAASPRRCSCGRRRRICIPSSRTC